MTFLWDTQWFVGQIDLILNLFCSQWSTFASYSQMPTSASVNKNLGCSQFSSSTAVNRSSLLQSVAHICCSQLPTSAAVIYQHFLQSISYVCCSKLPTGATVNSQPNLCWSGSSVSRNLSALIWSCRFDPMGLQMHKVSPFAGRLGSLVSARFRTKIKINILCWYNDDTNHILWPWTKCKRILYSIA